jgi:hypothetical protein
MMRVEPVKKSRSLATTLLDRPCSQLGGFVLGGMAAPAKPNYIGRPVVGMVAVDLFLPAHGTRLALEQAAAKCGLETDVRPSSLRVSCLPALLARQFRLLLGGFRRRAFSVAGQRHRSPAACGVSHV